MIKSINIGFENCEVATLPFVHIRGLVIDRISKKIIASQWDYSEIETCTYCKLVIKPDGNIEYNPFEMEEYKQTLFERISKYSDITSIGIIFENGTQKNYYVPWGDSECKNDYMKVSVENNIMSIEIQEI
jgi:hypothetical protein